MKTLSCSKAWLICMYIYCVDLFLLSKLSCSTLNKDRRLQKVFGCKKQEAKGGWRNYARIFATNDSGNMIRRKARMEEAM
jgi:hypothetical protein